MAVVVSPCTRTKWGRVSRTVLATACSTCAVTSWELLIGLHQIEVDVRANAEDIQCEVQHVTMLGRRAHQYAEVGIIPQRADHRRKLYDFWAGTQNNHDTRSHTNEGSRIVFG